MAAGTWTVINGAKAKMLNNTIALSTHAMKVALITSTATLTASTCPATYATLTNQVANGNGYTTTGVAVTGTASETSGTFKFTITNPTWSASTFDAKWAVLYADGATSKDVIAFVDLNVGAGLSVSPNNGTLTVTIDANGVFTIA